MTTKQTREDYTRKLFEVENPDGLVRQSDVDFFTRLSLNADLIWLYTEMEVKANEYHLRTGKDITELMRKVNIVKQSERFMNTLARSTDVMESKCNEQRRTIEILEKQLSVYLCNSDIKALQSEENLIKNFLNKKR